MIQTITNGSEYQAILNEKLNMGGRAGIPCPYCGGSDRFVQIVGKYRDQVFTDDLAVRFMCRTQAMLPPEERTHKPIISSAQVLREKADVIIELAPGVTWTDIADTMPALHGSSHSSGGGGISSRLRTMDTHAVAEAYVAGAKLWEDTTVFSPATIRRFKLGMVQWPNGYNRLLIPLPIPIEWTGRQMYLPKGRRMDPADTLPRKYDVPNGSPPMLFEAWAGDERQVDTYVIAEGEKSTIAAWQMGFSPTGTTTAGAAVWLDEWTARIMEYRPSQLIILGDDDAAGDAFVKKVYLSFQRWLADTDTDLDILAFGWPNFGSAADRTKADPYDILAEHGERAKQFVTAQLTRAIDLLYPRPDLQQYPTGPVADLDQLRSDDDGGLLHYMTAFVDGYSTLFYDKANEQYDVEESGTVLVERSAPGTGKSRAAVKLVERQALKIMEKAAIQNEKRELRRQQAREALEALEAMDMAQADKDSAREKLERVANLKNVPVNKVFYVAPFKNSWEDLLRAQQHPELWYPLEARTPDNCEFFDMQSRVASKGYTVMGRLCNGGICPFAERCKAEHGRYMHQFEEMRDFPIISLRHPHLMMKQLMDGAQLVVIDEDPHAEFLKPLQLGIPDLDDPLKLQELLSEDFDEAQVNMTLALTEALAKALASARHDSADTVRSGPDVLRLIDAQLQTTMYGVYSLRYLVSWLDHAVLDRLDSRTPEELFHLETIHLAPSGDFAKLLRIVMAEAGLHYEKLMQDAEYTWNSRLNIVQQRSASSDRRDTPVFVFYTVDKFPIPLKTPVVALDATGAAVKYAKSLGRTPLDHSSVVLNPDTQTVVFTGSTFAISTVRKESDVNGVPAFLVHDEWAMPGELDDTVPELSETLPDNPAYNDILKVIREVAERHESLLIVTYKSLRAKLQREVWRMGVDITRRLRWGHFRALRGSNAFEDTEAVLVIGTPRPPLRDTAMALSALFHDDPEPLDLSVGTVWEPYHSTGALPPARVRTFADERTHPFVTELEAGELLQCIGRIRPHTDRQHGTKYVYTLTERPAAQWVTHLVPYTEVTQRHDLTALADYVHRVDPSLKPTQAAVAAALEAQGITLGERRLRQLVSVMKKPKVLTDWLLSAIMPQIRKE